MSPPPPLPPPPPFMSLPLLPSYSPSLRVSARARWHWLRRSERRASRSLWKLRLKLRSKLSDLVELILMSFQVIAITKPAMYLFMEIQNIDSSYYPERPVKDLAFAVARFYQLGGTFMNYYMYHEGINFSRTTCALFVATSYDYDAPLDEYGIIRQPKWGHLKDLHNFIKFCEEALITTDPTITSLHPNIEDGRLKDQLRNDNFSSLEMVGKNSLHFIKGVTPMLPKNASSRKRKRTLHSLVQACSPTRNSV
ncbi:hypothetical protein S245_020565 [Arachis hypogaea]